MAKKCIICEEKEAKLQIKDSKESYCEECAEESFGDISVLVRIEEEAKRLKKIIEKNLSQDEEENEK